MFWILRPTRDYPSVYFGAFGKAWRFSWAREVFVPRLTRLRELVR